MWLAIRDTFNAAAQDDSIVCVLLCGSGDNFCAGVDLSSFSDPATTGEHPFEAAARAVADFDKPLVAAAQGVAIGGGATVLFHADIVYVAENLRMRLPFANLGLVPEWASSYMLQANIGAQRAAELFYTAEWIDADKALHCGIAADVLPDANLFDHALAKANEIAQWPVNSLQEIKRCLRLPHKQAIEAAFEVEQAAMSRQAGSPENIEAITAFIEKRPADFRNL
jgi:enoyl-CoA hydratase/carnithine racemase